MIQAHFHRAGLLGMALVLASLLLVVGCGPSGPFVWARDVPAAQQSNQNPGLIGQGDMVNVRVFGQENISVRGRITQNGMLAVPLLGEYPMAGKAPAQVASELEKRLTPFVTAPKVIVVIEESTLTVTALGEVRNNGRHVLQPPAAIADALAVAGGLTEFADESAIFVLRGGQRIRFTYEDVTRGSDHARRFLLAHGDMIVVE